MFLMQKRFACFRVVSPSSQYVFFILQGQLLSESQHQLKLSYTNTLSAQTCTKGVGVVSLHH